MEEKKDKKGFFSRLRHKFRMVIVDESTFEEQWSMRLSFMNVISVFGGIIFIFVVLTYVTIAYTPIKQLIPGYPDVYEEQKRKELEVQNQELIDSLKEVAIVHQQYSLNLRNILLGENVGDTNIQAPTNDSINYAAINFNSSEEDSLLRKKVEDQFKYNVDFSGSNQKGLLFYAPLKGEITQSIDIKKAHFGVDVVAPKNETIKSILDGTVVFSSWTSDGGHVIQVQHANNYVSMYKHNSVLLKKQGDIVKAGDPIAIIGNSGEHSTGPHVHFELWQNGKPLDPEKFIAF